VANGGMVLLFRKFCVLRRILGDVGV